MLGIDPVASAMTLQDVAKNRESWRTSESVRGMWEATAELQKPADESDPLSDWQPMELGKTAASRRKVRWPVVLIALVIGTGVALSLWWLPQASARRAVAHAEVMHEALAALSVDLASLQGALATATDPASDPAGLTGTAAALAAVSSAADRLLDLSNQPVPSPLPLGSQEPFDDLRTFARGLEPLAEEASSLVIDVNDIVGYRLALSAVLAFEELPLVADSATVTGQSAELARLLAESVAAFDSMAIVGPFSEHRALVEVEINAFAQWQKDYLQALRDDDISAVEELIEQMRLRRDGLAFAVVEPLASLRTAIDVRIIDHSHELNRSIALVPSF